MNNEIEQDMKFINRLIEKASSQLNTTTYIEHSAELLKAKAELYKAYAFNNFIKEFRYKGFR